MMTRPINHCRPMACRTGGFTLVELLVTVTIIAMLAGLSLVALAAARQSARVDATRATIEKINAIIMDRYESYHTRRLPVDQQEIEDIGQIVYPSDSPGLARDSKVRLQALRDLMRMEMPDRWSDVFRVDSSLWPNFDTILITSTDWRPNQILPPVPPATPPPDKTPTLTIHYFRKCQAAWSAMKAANPSATDAARMENLESLGAAECLYMIVMSDPDAAAQVHSDEIGDTDGDGLSEFLDGWGRPIRFIRWPAGFVSANNGDSDLQVADPIGHHDPFDPNRVDDAAYALYPLIYSTGPDSKYDINIGKDNTGGQNLTASYEAPLDPYANDPNGNLVGRPLDDDVVLPGGDPTQNLNHYDNIHNHRVEGR